MKKRDGFTLIEMMIAMAILAFISLAIYQNTSSSFTLRNTIEQDGDFYNSVRVALDIMGRDITHMYSPQAAALPGQMGDASTGKPNQVGSNTPSQSPSPFYFPINPDAPPSDFWGNAINTDGVKPSRIQGSPNKLSFITSDHLRLFKDSHECDFAKITYTLEDDKLPPVNPKDHSHPLGQVLIRTENPKAFQDQEDEEDNVTYRMITGIKSLKFAYLDGSQDTWHGHWDNTELAHKGKFPTVIRITLQIYRPNSKTPFKVKQLYRPELPL